MTVARYRDRLPQLGDVHLLTDGGIETTLIFHDGLDLPYFASFTLLNSIWGRNALERYYTSYINVARQQDAGFILDSATWRASRDWGDILGYSEQELAAANRRAVNLLIGLRERYEADQPFVISGNIGPRGDGYVAETMMTAAESDDYHSAQIATLDQAGVDMISAITMTHAGEAAGIARACARRDVPLALAFTVETDGRLPTGQSLGDAIAEVDADLSGGPAYYMVNCAHPDHFESAIDRGSDWAARIRGLRANASRQSHAELDVAQQLDAGDPVELARDYVRIKALLPNLRVYGGCCGTDHRHVREIGELCMPMQAA